MVIVGLVTSVIMRVGSVTSTCLRSSAGDMRTLSGPMLPVSSGALPGQISTTCGSAAATDHAIINDANSNKADEVVFMLRFPASELVKVFESDRQALSSSNRVRLHARNCGAGIFLPRPCVLRRRTRLRHEQRRERSPVEPELLLFGRRRKVPAPD